MKNIMKIFTTIFFVLSVNGLVYAVDIDFPKDIDFSNSTMQVVDSDTIIIRNTKSLGCDYWIVFDWDSINNIWVVNNYGQNYPQPDEGLYDDFNGGSIDPFLWSIYENHNRGPIEADGVARFINDIQYPEETSAALTMPFNGYNWIQSKLKLAAGRTGLSAIGISGEWFHINGSLVSSGAQISSSEGGKATIGFFVANVDPRLEPTWHELFRSEIPAKLDRWYEVKVHFAGDRINYYVDGSLRKTYFLPAVAQSFTGKSFKITSWTYINATTEAYVDDVYVGY